MDEHQIGFKLNGRDIRVKVESNTTLLDLLRRNLKVTSVKRGCEVGECGACAVLLEGKPVLSCLIFAPSVEGKEVTTLEGLTKEGKLHPIQEAFLKTDAVQCGFCTPGMILTAKALLDRKPKPSVEDVKNAIEGNLCRCTGYAKIVDAVMLAANEFRKA